VSGRIVHIVGAGIAGLSAAVHLAEAGETTVIHEAAGAAGGRCRSFFDPALGAVIDNGAHLLLSGNRAALDFLTRIGSLDCLSGPSETIFDFADLGSGERWRLRLNPGRAPWWLFDRSRRAPGTELKEYFAPLPILWSPATATVARAMSCKGPLYERLWRPLLLAGLNTEPREGSAALAGALLRKTLGAGGRACRPLIAKEGLSSTFVDPAIAFVEARGGSVRLNDRLRGVQFSGGRAVSLDFETGPVQLGAGDALVVAVPPWAAQSFLPDLETPNEFRAIVNAHFRIRPPTDHPAILGVVGGLTQWLFAYPERLSVTISAADSLVDRPRAVLADEIWQEVAALTGLPASLPPWQIVKEKRATFAATPQQDARRPGCRTRWSNVWLAGDWTRTGLPATIEGAAQSGQEAASRVIATRHFPKAAARIAQ
jgi:squalene-associated FAD-dependent desaturase